MSDITNKESKSFYFENLDGLRFFAFLAVFFAHSFYTRDEALQQSGFLQAVLRVSGLGTLGVNFFFVLSGYLITYLLEKEYSKNNRIDIKSFYIRRALRIWPLFYAMVIVGFIVQPAVMKLIGDPYQETGSVLYYIFFVNNYDVAPYSAVLGVLWSIAVEEQFYLFWPLLLFVFPKFRLGIILGVILFSFIWRQAGLGSYTGTLTCVGDLAFGALLGYLSCHSKSFVSYFTSFNRYYILIIYFIGLMLIYQKPLFSATIFSSSHRLLLSAFFGFVIMEQNYSSNSLFKLSNFPILSFLGRYTYGLYVLHFVSIYAIGKIFEYLQWNGFLFNLLITEVVLSFLLSIALAYASY
ncbi:MAG: peptidoglycan/LPS O-acetylase OafA/YrhL, partial [Psychroserpens sp.]